MINDEKRALENGLATPGDVATYLRTTERRLAKLRHLGTGPQFVKVGRRVLYRWTDVHDWLNANTHLKT